MSETNDCMLTTFDNPFNPFEQFTSWFLFDVEKGYNTCSYLARITQISDEMSQQEEDEEIERAIDKIIEYDFLNIYKKVKRNDYKTKNVAKEPVHNEESEQNSNIS